MRTARIFQTDARNCARNADLHWAFATVDERTIVSCDINRAGISGVCMTCLLYTSDAADE